jgi:hypothetical protein
MAAEQRHTEPEQLHALRRPCRMTCADLAASPAPTLPNAQRRRCCMPSAAAAARTPACLPARLPARLPVCLPTYANKSLFIEPCPAIFLKKLRISTVSEFQRPRLVQTVSKRIRNAKFILKRMNAVVSAGKNTFPDVTPRRFTKRKTKNRD